MPEEDPVRKEKISAILDQEVEDGQNLAAEARKLIHYLLIEKKGYLPEDVRMNVAFEVALEQETAHSSVDFLVSLDNRKAMIIKCAAGSLSSRERQAVAAARVLGTPPVPIAVVADPVNAVVLDVSTGEVTGEGFGAIPVREQLHRILSEGKSAALSPERVMKEKRILLAFDSIQCCVPQGGDGGVQIGEPEK